MLYCGVPLSYIPIQEVGCTASEFEKSELDERDPRSHCCL
jgi:hypothetical protein